jgi:hypothetical protein
MNKISDLNLENADLIEKSYRASDLVGKTFSVMDFEVLTGDTGQYLKIKISGNEVDGEKSLLTGAKNIVEKLRLAKEQNLLPLKATLVKIGRAFDLE